MLGAGRPGQLHRIFDQISHAQLVLCANDQVNAGNALQHLRSHLCVATDDRNERFRITPQDLIDKLAAFAVGVLGHRAGIDDANIAGLAERDDVIPLRTKPAGNQRGFRLIQAAAERVKRGSEFCVGHTNLKKTEMIFSQSCCSNDNTE